MIMDEAQFAARIFILPSEDNDNSKVQWKREHNLFSVSKVDRIKIFVA